MSVDDEGFYECIATNKSGKATSKCELLVNGMKLLSLVKNIKEDTIPSFRIIYIYYIE